MGELIEGTDGQLYGVAIQGGNRQACRRGCGTVFQVTREMKVTPIHFFNGVDGQFPRAALLQASDGNLYGTTEFGGSSFACSDCGIVFRIMSDGRFELLRALRGSNEGKNPQGKLLQATDGSLYGTAPDGGFGGEGTAFRLTQRWRRQRGDLLMS